MRVSIIIPAFNEEKLLGKTLAASEQSAAALRELGWETELVVCDNNSTDRTAEIAKSAGARVIFEPVNQIGRARNAGASIAKGDWFIFIDADSIPSAQLFRAVAQNIATGKCIGGGCLVQLDEPNRVANRFVSLWNVLSRTARWAAGSFIYCDARAFRELHGFSARLYASEEIEFSQRLKRFGRREGRKMMIIAQPRLVTSARKLHLYKPREHAWFMLKAFLMPWKVLTNRDECLTWYDGRR